MYARFVNIWEKIRTSFWFVPAAMVLAATVFAFTVVALDQLVDSDSMRRFEILYEVSAEGARAILSTIAGSIITVAGVTFSIVIVVLNLASSQFGPRLLRNFMKDRSIQFVLGTFVSSFIYCLLVLRSVETTGAEAFVPSFAVTLAVVVAVLNVGVLIFFIHHTATSIQADRVVAESGRELLAAIERLFPERLADETPEDEDKRERTGREGDGHYYIHHLAADRDGYLQVINYDELVQTARDNDWRLYLQYRPGDYIAAGSVLAIVSSTELFDVQAGRRINEAFIVGEERSPEQDAEYSVHQLVELAIRALSPGINDPYSAIACIDRLGSALCRLTDRRLPPAQRFDAEGTLRLSLKPLTFRGVLDSSFDQIRHYGRENRLVTVRLLETLITIAQQSRRPGQRRAIRRQGEMVLRASRTSLPEPNDRDDAEQRYRLLEHILDAFAGDGGPAVDSFDPSRRSDRTGTAGPVRT